ncbi:hypothetical protein DL96DRAFT_1557269 [Flagelloscypha sp. PMI_526]|nr:hypothetical protein DL96DRAFT_1557269 [Flagelloscypha sp. PMI_526]
MRFPLITSITLVVLPLALAAPVGLVSFVAPHRSTPIDIRWKRPLNNFNLGKRNDIPCGAIGFCGGPSISLNFPPSTGSVPDKRTGGPGKPSKQDDDVEVPSSQNEENDDSGEQGDEDEGPGDQGEEDDDEDSNEDDEDEDVGEPGEEDEGDEDTTEKDNEDEESEIRVMLLALIMVQLKEKKLSLTNGPYAQEVRLLGEKVHNEILSSTRVARSLLLHTCRYPTVDVAGLLRILQIRMIKNLRRSWHSNLNLLQGTKPPELQPDSKFGPKCWANASKFDLGHHRNSPWFSL